MHHSCLNYVPIIHPQLGIYCIHFIPTCTYIYIYKVCSIYMCVYKAFHSMLFKRLIACVVGYQWACAPPCGWGNVAAKVIICRQSEYRLTKTFAVKTSSVTSSFATFLLCKTARTSIGILDTMYAHYVLVVYNCTGFNSILSVRTVAHYLGTVVGGPTVLHSSGGSNGR